MLSLGASQVNYTQYVIKVTLVRVQLSTSWIATSISSSTAAIISHTLSWPSYHTGACAFLVLHRVPEVVD